MNETINQDLVTVTPNEEGVDYIVIAYRDLDGGSVKRNIQAHCQGSHMLMAVEDLARNMMQNYQAGERFQAADEDTQRRALNGFKRLIIAQAAKGADYSAGELISDLLDNLLDALSDDPKDEE